MTVDEMVEDLNRMAADNAGNTRDGCWRFP